jgi:hypothetical protein
MTEIEQVYLTKRKFHLKEHESKENLNKKNNNNNIFFKPNNISHNFNEAFASFFCLAENEGIVVGKENEVVFLKKKYNHK